MMHIFESFAEAMYKLTEIAMAVAPIGVFALIANAAGQYGLDERTGRAHLQRRAEH